MASIGDAKSLLAKVEEQENKVKSLRSSNADQVINIQVLFVNC
jgi:hypothetical protein